MNKKTILKLIGMALFACTTYAQAATLYVCSTCAFQTIQSAVASANTNDTVYIYNGTYNEHDILVERKISIVGQSQNNTVIDAGNNGRHFIISDSSDSVGIGTMKLINGDADNSSVNCGSFTSGRGGSICIDGVILKVWKTTFKNNNAEKLGGAIYIRGDNSTNGILAAYSSTFTDNYIDGTVTNGDTGGAITCSYCDEVYLDDNVFQGNAAVPTPIPNDPNAGNGGAVGAYGVNYFESQRNSYLKNYAGGTGGAVYIRLNSQTDGKAKFVNDTMGHNYSGLTGGAISNASYSSGDTAVTISRSTFYKNKSTDGGALRSIGAFYIDNSTFTKNSAIDEGGAIKIDSSYNDYHVANSTFYGNYVDTADGGSVITSYALLGTGDVQVSNSIMSGNNDIECQTGGFGFVVGEHNLTETDSCDLANGANSGPYGFTQPFSLGPVTDFDTSLQNNGGITLTHAIGNQSNAIDSGADNCPSVINPGVPLTHDQRGYQRIKYCDIGSYEYQ